MPKKHKSGGNGATSTSRAALAADKLGKDLFTLPLYELALTLLVSDGERRDIMWATELAELLSLAEYEGDCLKAICQDSYMANHFYALGPESFDEIAASFLTVNPHHFQAFTFLNLLEISDELLAEFFNRKGYSKESLYRLAFTCGRFGNLNLVAAILEDRILESTDVGLMEYGDSIFCGAIAGGHYHLITGSTGSGTLSFFRRHDHYKAGQVSTQEKVRKVLGEAFFANAMNIQYPKPIDFGALVFLSQRDTGSKVKDDLTGGEQFLQEMEESKHRRMMAEAGGDVDLVEGVVANRPTSRTNRNSGSGVARLLEYFFAHGLDTSYVGISMKTYVELGQVDCVRAFLDAGVDPNSPKWKWLEQWLAACAHCHENAGKSNERLQEEAAAKEEQYQIEVSRARAARRPIPPRPEVPEADDVSTSDFTIQWPEGRYVATSGHYPEGNGSSLAVACMSGDRQMVELLIERGAYISAAAVKAAAAGNHFSLLRDLLVKYSASPITDSRNLLFYAARYDRKEYIDLLVDRGVALMPATNSPILAAAKRGYYDFVTRLLDLGADGSDKPEGYDLLGYCLKAGKIELAERLILRKSPVPTSGTAKHQDPTGNHEGGSENDDEDSTEDCAESRKKKRGKKGGKESKPVRSAGSPFHDDVPYIRLLLQRIGVVRAKAKLSPQSAIEATISTFSGSTDLRKSKLPVALVGKTSGRAGGSKKKAQLKHAEFASDDSADEEIRRLEAKGKCKMDKPQLLEPINAAILNKTDLMIECEKEEDALVNLAQLLLETGQVEPDNTSIKTDLDVASDIGNRRLVSMLRKAGARPGSKKDQVDLQRQKQAEFEAARRHGGRKKK